MSYPKMIYRGGVLSGNQADQRIVASADEEMLAAEDGFVPWTSKAAPVAAVQSASQALAAEQAAFAAAASGESEPEEPEPPRRAGVARGRRQVQ